MERHSDIRDGVLIRFSDLDLDENGKYIVPNDVTAIYGGAFSRSERLKEIVLNDHIEELPDCAFLNCYSLEKIKLSKDLKSIGELCFGDCVNLTEIELPSSLQKIDKHAFVGTALKSVEVPDSVHEIGEGVFKFCQQLTSVKLPKLLIKLPQETFQSCVNLKKVVLPENLIIIGEQAFMHSGIEELVLGETVHKLEKQAFALCDKLKVVEIKGNIVEIPEECFNYSGLQSISLPVGLMMIHDHAFNNTKLKSVNLPPSLITIGKNAFCNCLLSEVEIPPRVEYIGSLCFALNGHLTKVTLPETIKDYDESMLERTNISQVNFVSNGAVVKEYKLSKLLNIDFVYGDEMVSSLEDYSKIDKQIRAKISYNFLKKLSKEDREKFLDSAYFKIYNNVLKRALMNGISIFEPEHNEYFCKLTTLCYNMGVFSQDIQYANKAGVFICDKLIPYYTESEFNRMFDIMQVNGFNKGFSEFLMTSFPEIVKSKEIPHFISRIYNEFDVAQSRHTSNRGKQRMLAPTVDFFEKYFRKNKFAGINSDNIDISIELGKFYIRQDTFDLGVSLIEKSKSLATSDVFNLALVEFPFRAAELYRRKYLELATETLDILGEIADRKFTYQWLLKNDPKNLTLGKYCNCCSHLEGIGKPLVIATMSRPDMRNLVVKNSEGVIVAKTTLYINKEQGYGICNNVEVNLDLAKDDRKEVVKAVMRGLYDFISLYDKENPDRPIKQLNVGLGFNDATVELQKYAIKNRPKLEGVHFSEYALSDPNSAYDGDWKDSQVCVYVNDDIPQ